MDAKYYRKGRTYFEVKPDRVMKVTNKAFVTEVVIAHTNEMQMAFLISSAEEGQETTRLEFEKHFLEASRLIVLEP